MKKNGGFSLFELLIVLAVIAVVSAIVTPNIISWRNNAKLRGAAGNLKNDMEMAKVQAIKVNNHVAVKFMGNRYEIFIDKSDDGIRDVDEQILKTRTLPAGVAFDLNQTTFASDVASFNGRGTARKGSAILTNTKGDEKQIQVETLGRIWFKK